MTEPMNLPTTLQRLNGDTQPTINARDLHERLQVGRDFSNWIKDRIERFGFEADVDYRSPNSASAKNQGIQRFMPGHNRKEYFLSLDMAKEIALVENNAQGRAIRRALIEMERQMREDVPALVKQLKMQLASSNAELLTARPRWANIKRYKDMGLTQVEIAKLEGITPSTVRGHLKRMNACRVTEYRPDPKLVELGRQNMFKLSHGGRS